jgi:putative transposase
MAQHKDWPHAPLHRFDSNGIYMVTASTIGKRHLFTTPDKLDLLENNLLSLAKKYRWNLEAWAVFSNHYHFIARNEIGSGPLNKFLSHLHTATAAELNRLDNESGRTVWFNFWDTKLTYERSYLARLSYVLRNAVKHGLALVPSQYPWCSAAWFERTTSTAMIKTIYGFKIDKVRIDDDY